MELAEKLATVLKAPSLEGADDAQQRFVRFHFQHEDDDEEGNGLPDLVLERAKVEAANAQICQQNRIPSVASERLRGPFAMA